MGELRLPDLASRALEVVGKDLDTIHIQSQYVEGVSEEKRRRDLAAALVVKNRRMDMATPPEDIEARVRSEGGVYYASSRKFAGILCWVGRVSLVSCVNLKVFP